MTPRERVLAAFRREEPDKVPKTASFCPALLERFRKETGAKNPDDYFEIELRRVWLGPTRRQTDFSPFLPAEQLPPGRSRVNEWGVGWVRGSVHHFEDMVHPMSSFTKLEEFEAYPYPDVDQPYRYEKTAELVEKRHARDLAVIASVPGNGTIFETAWALRSLEQMLVDLAVNEELAAYQLDRLTALAETSARRLVRAGVDVFHTGDDVATQRGMMMSPEMWRKWLKPRLARVIAAAREERPDLLVSYHSDGDVRAIIPELIEIGVQVLNPVQPECLDPVEMKRLYGDRLAFWGTVGTQTTMPFGTPEEVRRVVKERIETVGAGGGLLPAPTHLLEPDVPWENVLAFFAAVEEYGSASGSPAPHSAG